MSVTPSTTASRDWEVPSPDSFRNRLLLITITRGDGTPMDASSILEEDIMEICIRRAHTHPSGVLWYSTAESVVLFRSLEDVNCAHHTLLDVTEFYPTTGDGKPHTPPQQSPPSEETPHHLHAQLGDLNDSEL